MAIPDSSPCRIFHRVFTQDGCGACSAFAVATVLAMRACLRDGRDFIPSPYRIFDCSGGNCDKGVSLSKAMAVARFGVGDIDQSVHAFGLPCDLKFEQHIDVGLRTMIYRDEIKRHVMNYGPVAASIKVDGENHAVVLIGWTPDNEWTIQNSWGVLWGDWHGRGNISLDSLRYAVSLDRPSTRMHEFLIVALIVCEVIVCVWAFAATVWEAK